MAHLPAPHGPRSQTRARRIPQSSVNAEKESKGGLTEASHGISGSIDGATFDQGSPHAGLFLRQTSVLPHALGQETNGTESGNISEAKEIEQRRVERRGVERKRDDSFPCFVAPSFQVFLHTLVTRPGALQIPAPRAWNARPRLSTTGMARRETPYRM